MQNTYLGEALWLFFVLLVLLMLGRAAFVFPISLLHNLWSREKLAKREMVVIWYVHKACTNSIETAADEVSCNWLMYSAYKPVCFAMSKAGLLVATVCNKHKLIRCML